MNRSSTKLKMSAESQLATLATELHSTRSALEAQNLEAQKRIKMLESSITIALESNEALKLQHSERGLELIRAESMLSQSVLHIKRLEHLLERSKLDVELVRHAADAPGNGAAALSSPDCPPGGRRKHQESSASPPKDDFASLTLEDLKSMLRHEKIESDLLRQKVTQAERRIDDLDSDVGGLHTMVARMKELLRQQDEKLQNEREVMNDELRRAQLLLTSKLTSQSSNSSLSRTASVSASSLKRPERPESPPSSASAAPNSTLGDSPATRVASLTVEPSVVSPMFSPLARRPSFMDSTSPGPRSMSPDPNRRDTMSGSDPSSSAQQPSSQNSTQTFSQPNHTNHMRAISGRNLAEFRKMLATSQSLVVPPASLEERGGWLLKEGGIVRSWKKRWFVVRLDKLIYFTDHHCKELKGEIVLTPRSYVTEAHEHTKKEHSFGVYDLNNSGRTYFLQAASKQEADDWVAFLTRKIASLSGPT